jgi:hypothetical protein
MQWSDGQTSAGCTIPCRRYGGRDVEMSNGYGGQMPACLVDGIVAGGAAPWGRCPGVRTPSR